MHAPKSRPKSGNVDKKWFSTTKRKKLWIKKQGFAQIVPKSQKNT